MKKIDMLWVRACKSMHPEQRLKSLYRRFYLPENLDNRHLTIILMGICRQYYPVDADRFIENMQPAYMNPNQPYWDIISQIVIGHIRWSHRDEWKDSGIIWSSKWRKQMQKEVA
jgi:hypothetical protein